MAWCVGVRSERGCGSQHAESELVLLLHLRPVGDDALLPEVPLALRGHVRVEVAAADLRVLQFAGARHLDPLLDALVRLVLAGHGNTLTWRGGAAVRSRGQKPE